MRSFLVLSLVVLAAAAAGAASETPPASNSSVAPSTSSPSGPPAVPRAAGLANTSFPTPDKRIIGLYFSTSYGRWCGPGNSGYNSCSQQCNRNNVVDSQSLPSNACLAQCQPVDALDQLCAIHDTCLYRPTVVAGKSAHPTSCSYLLGAKTSDNSCSCDKALVDGAGRLTASECRGITPIPGVTVPNSCGAYRYNLLFAFRTQVACWAYAGGTKNCYSTSTASVPAGSPNGAWAERAYVPPKNCCCRRAWWCAWLCCTSRTCQC